MSQRHPTVARDPGARLHRFPFEPHRTPVSVAYQSSTAPAITTPRASRSAYHSPARTLSETFGQMVRERDHPGLERWVTAAEKSNLRELVSFVAGIRRDRAAVEQMLSTEWSNGQCEGQINRVKMIKRQMYGRANFDLLRQRVLHAA